MQSCFHPEFRKLYKEELFEVNGDLPSGLLHQNKEEVEEQQEDEDIIGVSNSTRGTLTDSLQSVTSQNCRKKGFARKMPLTTLLMRGKQDRELQEVCVFCDGW